MTSPDDKEREELVRLREEVERLRATVSRLGPGLETMLKLRGFEIYRKEPRESILVPALPSLDEYYSLMRKYSFRLFLRDVIKHRHDFTLEQVTRYATPETVAEYARYLVTKGLLNRDGNRYSVAAGAVRSFGETLEWYVAELLRREFGAEAVWGVKFRRPKVGGDYDVIARIGSVLAYAEVKSSPPKQIYDSEIGAFLDRVEDLVPDIALFLMDTELRMKDKIVPSFEKALAGRGSAPPVVERMERELFHVGDRVFILNAREDIVQNIRAALAWYFRRVPAHPPGTASSRERAAS
jgi:hypothetical protein